MSMSESRRSAHWLDQYASDFHHWRTATHDGHTIFYRPLGHVEYAFDTDGTYHEGRADLTIQLRLEVKSGLSNEDFRQKLILVWTVLRLHHVLLLSQAVSRQAYMKDDVPMLRDRFAVVRVPNCVDEAVNDAKEHVIFTDDFQAGVNPDEFHIHAQNAGRALDETRSLSKLFVFPTTKSSKQRMTLRLLLVMGHQITDGLTNAVWMSHFLSLFNTSSSKLRASISNLLTTSSLKSRLPLPQEDLYPRIPGNTARRRWFWLLTLVLRHIKKPQPSCFPNPLRRSTPLTNAIAPQPLYPSLLNYDRTPPLNSASASVRISLASTQRLHRLCRAANCSIGAGCFVLVALSMMDMHESQFPAIPLSARLPFIGSFPINPRPFFNHHSEPNSLMLSFSDGVVLPFLPSSLGLEGRIKLLVRSAHRQLFRYQKKSFLPTTTVPGTTNTDGKVRVVASLTTSPARMIATNYIAAVERTEAKLPPEARSGLNPQGELGVRPNPGLATCGVSSVGRFSDELRAGRFDVGDEAGGGGLEGEEEKDRGVFVADLRELKQNVRAREGEFLVGIGGDDQGVWANVSYDASTMDEALVQKWRERMVTLLEEDDSDGQARAML